jgi:hypothetical protein
MISGNDSETKSNSVVSIPAIVFVAIGLFAIIIGIALVAFFGGFYVMDEWDSKDWTETEILAIGQDYTADEGTQIFFYNYSVDGVEYNSTFSCDYFIGSGAQSADESSTLAPWKTQCLHDSEYYLNLESVAYNPGEPSEIDVYPGFTYRMIFEVYAPKLGPLVLMVVGIVIVLRGVFGPSFGPWAYVAGKITNIKAQIADGDDDDPEDEKELV